SQLGRKLDLRILPRAELLPALAQGEIDIVMSGLAINERNSALANFTRPYVQAGLMAIIRTADVMRFRSPAALLQGGYRAGFVRGGAASDYVRTQLPDAAPVPLASADEALQALLDKRIDVLIDAAAT